VEGRLVRRCVFVLLLACPTTAWAADTVEPWDAGAFDVDFYVGSDGIGRGHAEAVLGSELMLGYGLINRLSVYAGTTLESTAELNDAAGMIFFGVFGTVLDTRHVDLDLFLDVRAGGSRFGAQQLTPSLELNLDAEPGLAAWGFYLRSGAAFAREDAGAEADLSLALEITIGGYWTVARCHQLLLELDGAYLADDGEDTRAFDLGSVRLGYNVGVTETIELITELSVDLPQAGERVAWGLLAGFILTLPGRCDVARRAAR